MAGLDSRWLQAACLAIAGITPPCSAADDWLQDAKGCQVAAQLRAANQTIEWSGTCRDGRAEGRGQLRNFVDGVQTLTYDGDMKAGRPSGQGVLTTRSGTHYEGGFLDGLYAGAGRLTDGKGSIRQGNFRAGLLDGPCSIVWASGLRFDGECEQGSIDGGGQLQYKNGDRYTGSFKFGVLQGQGRYAWANGDVYEGGFKENRLFGSGDYQFADGSRYGGAFVGGRPSGQGRVALPDGLGYEGGFEAGAPTGNGRFFKPGEVALPDSPQQRTQLTLAYAAPQQAFLFQTQPAPRPLRVTARQICQTMGQPQVPALNWQGEAVYKAMAEVRDGRMVSVQVTAPKPASSPAVHAALVASIERALRQTYVCAGTHVFEQEFAFRYGP